MRISKRALSIKHNIEIQWLSVLCDNGYLKYEKRNRRYFINEKDFFNLMEGEHYVICPFCGKKMGGICKKHYSLCCPDKNFENRYAYINLKARKKTEKQKLEQSRKLKDRFKTKEGKETLKIIKENSIRINSDPNFIDRKKEISREIQNRPEIKKYKKKRMKEIWSDPVHREKRMKNIQNNIDEYRKSASNARRYLNKTSKLHESYKVAMMEKELSGFITEYREGFYHIDEADPFAKIAIEIDGCYWHGCATCGFNGDKRIMSIDKKKETYLKNRGWVIIHIKEHEIKKNKYTCIEAIRSLQNKRTENFKDKIKYSFLKGKLSVKSYNKDTNSISWENISNVLKHHTPYKNILSVKTEISEIGVTEDHSLFDFNQKEKIKTSEIKVGDRIVGKDYKDNIIPLEIIDIEKKDNEKYTFDISVPGNENFFTASGILAHNSYSISGVSLDLDKSSKYQSMKDSFESEYDKILELAKRSIKIAVGLRMPRYGIGISSALGPYSRPGVQSRRNYVSGFRGGWT